MTNSRTYFFGDRPFSFGDRTYVMGIVNVTPDSFYDGGKYDSPAAALEHARKLIEAGADIIDVGGESTRPKGPYGEGAKRISQEEELQRIMPVIEKLAPTSSCVISIDTTRSEIADAALKSGASIVNDISAMRFDPRMAEVVAKHRASIVLMHMQGTPDTMQHNPQYIDVVREVKEELRKQKDLAKAAGIDQVLLDPGLGFGKTAQHNFTLLKHLRELSELGCPIVIGPSRKAFTGSALQLPPNERLEGTAGAVAASILHGADIIRVHDVREMKRVAVVVDAVISAP